MPKERKIFVIAKFREFDEAAWRRLVIAYVYALYARRREATEADREEEDRPKDAVSQEGTV